ncbi:hypothetical protein V1525DRAFT_367180 [Lipomyces kononenkoae]|uniref:Uncharacterized protein n=1 Tax=Lipomyces kononenkoae TaxID=34357 RepID=A0ACC3SSA5_LIPKO
MQSGGDRGSTSYYAGLYEDGFWKCNCQPPRQAAYREVKKEGRNKGRFFYACATGKCKFFLWEEDAHPRETNSTTTQAHKRRLNANPAATTRHQNQSSTDTSPAASTGRQVVNPENISTEGSGRKDAFGAGFDESVTGVDSIRRDWARVLTQTKPRLEVLETENERLLSRREELSENIRDLRERITREEDRLLRLKAHRRDLESLGNGRR